MERPPAVGVEEEFVLLDPVTGAVRPEAPAVIGACGDPERLVEESMTYMVETRTPVCRTLDEVRQSLRETRAAVASAARRQGTVSASTGVPPYGAAPNVTDGARYRELARRFPHAMSAAGVCACHVHVGVPDRDVAVQVLLRLRRWLPVLIAMTASSPIWEGRDSGWASLRFELVSRWPTAVPAPPVESAQGYDRLVRRAVESGAALDPRSVYYLARLSPRHPTVEVRVADACLTVDETVAYAGMVRALVATSAEDASRGEPVAGVAQATLLSACRSAAQHGLTGLVLDPLTERPVPPWDLVEALANGVVPWLRRYGDADRVEAWIDRLRRSGIGADRQRRLFRGSGSPEEFVAALASATLAGCDEPGT